MTDAEVAQVELAALHRLITLANKAPHEAKRVTISAELVAADFVAPHLGKIWDVLSTAAVAERPMDALETKHFLGSAVTMAQVEGVFHPPEGPWEFFDSLDAAPKPPAKLFEIVRDMSERRKIKRVLETALRAIGDTSNATGAVMAQAKTDLEALNIGPAKPIDGAAVALEFRARLDDIRAGKVEPFISTGIPQLDAVIGGFQTRIISIIAALPGIGKSALVLSIMRNIAGRGIRVGVMSLEDDPSWIPNRLAAEAAKISLLRIQHSPITDEELKRVDDIHEKHVYNPMQYMQIDARQGLTISEVVAMGRRMSLEGMKILFIDHAGEISFERGDRPDLAITDALRELRGLSISCNIPVVVVAHVRRRDGLGINDKPTLTDVAGSAGFERIPRLILGAHRDALTGDLCVSVLKQNSGPLTVNPIHLALNQTAGVVA